MAWLIDPAGSALSVFNRGINETLAVESMLFIILVNL
jgi:hypothetical protein